MPRLTPSAALLPTIGLVMASALAGCSDDAPPPVQAQPTDTGVVHLPTSVAPTTDSAGHRIQALPAQASRPALTDERVRGFDYSYRQPVGWSQGERDLDPPPDTVVQPDDTDVPAFIAVERPIRIGSSSLKEAVDRLRSGFEEKGFRPMAAPERQVGGYSAMGIVVDQSDELRHVYYVVAYAEQAFAIRLTYDPNRPEALDVYRAVLDSWSWG
ncbi:hypothetical protein [Terrabacter terrigena]|uniref:DUF1795 domain-containing protein n=1 Tax=Terrabacter terrigena TaxID=574718 RepID=A0ABW3MRE9_9MICO